MLQEVKKVFLEKFSSNPTIVRSPGRINILGEHTDYNCGLVLPAAISKEIYFAVSPNSLGVHRLYSYDFSEYLECSSHNVEKQASKLWSNYLLGVIAQLEKADISVSGVDVVFGGNIPIGAGVSSSAAIECGFIYALNTIFDLGLSKIQMVQMAQKAEHEFAGVNCGIMDQFAVMFGQKNSVIQLDCRSLEYAIVPFELPNCEIILCNSMVSHNLASSEYNIRRQQCEEGVAIVAQKYPQVKSLRDISITQLQESASLLPGNMFDRCAYVVEEIQRVYSICDALQQNNVDEIGKLMYATHSGLQHKYNVSCAELDELVEIAAHTSGVIGSRMMGGGFGGCTISLVHFEAVPKFIEQVQTKFYKKHNKQEQIIRATISEGTSCI